MAGIRLLLVAAALLLADPATAEIRPATTALEAAPDHLHLEMAVQFNDGDAQRVRLEIERDHGDHDGYVSASEIGRYQGAHRVEATRDDPECYRDLTFLRIDGQTPKRLRLSTVEIRGAEGWVTDATPFTLVARYDYEYPPPAAPSAHLQLDLADLDPDELLPKCVDPPRQDLTGVYVYFGEPADWRDARLRIHPRNGDAFERQRIIPAQAVGLWDGKGLSGDTPQERQMLLSNHVVIPFHAYEAPSAVVQSAPETPRFSTAWVIAVVMAVALMAGAATEFGRYSLSRTAWALFAFTRLEKDRVLESERRDQIYSLVQTEPGLCLADLRRRTGLAHGTALHHLRVLEQQGFVRTVRDGFRARFFLRGPRVDPKPYLTDLQQRILTLLARSPGLSQSDVASALEMPRKSTAHHLDRLAMMGLIQSERDGQRLRYRGLPVSPARPPSA